MRTALGAVLAAAVVLSPTGPAARAAEQGDIDKAVARGVDYLHGAAFPGNNDSLQPVGVMALTGLTLLECGAGPDDKTVRAAAANVRQAAVAQDQTYSLALSILFLDRLGDSEDVPLIESMTVRLLAGQTAGGGWTYSCPTIPESEVRRLAAHLKQQTELVGRRDPPKEAEKDKPKDKNDKATRRTVKDLPKEIQEQLVLINRTVEPGGSAGPVTLGGDNSNTQFATVALWVARRHGLPVDLALGRIDRRYRLSQNADGGWSYIPMTGTYAMMMGGSSATMTCAGLLGLAVAQGVVADADHEAGKPGRDLGKDQALKKALALLGTALDAPADRRTAAGGKTYYFLWSLERVSVALDLDTVGGKDWYAWGSDLLLANQAADGSWSGEYAGAVDTCFALLFLKRANLTSDLTAGLKGMTKDLGGVSLKAGGVGGAALKGGLKSGVESKDKPSGNGAGVAGKPVKDPAEARVTTAPPAGEETEGGRMARELAQADAGRREELVAKYRDGKGVTYTEALAGAIPQMTGDGRRLAREALTDRLTRMKPETLARYFEDQDAEVRRAAALAAAQREAKTLIPNLIPLLNDAEPSVARAAQAALKDLTGEALGPSADEWKAWWDKREGK